MDLTICVATYGHPYWIDLAHERAIPSAQAQGCDVIHVHGKTLAEARNQAAEQAATPLLCFLDADDELADGYAETMVEGSADMRAPRLLQLLPDGSSQMVDVASRDIEKLNPCCIGTTVRRSMFLEAGGFPDFRAYEDWALFLRMSRRGATLEHVPATYIQHVRVNSRNVVTNPRKLMDEIRAWA